MHKYPSMPEIMENQDRYTKSHIIVTTHQAPFENLADCLTKTADREERDDGFYMMNMDKVIHKYRQWMEFLPRIRPFYAIKCNPDPVLVRLLHLLGTGFDCASKVEIELALDAGSKPSDIVYAHPCKKTSYVRFAAKRGVTKMTIDSKEELFKIKEHYPNAEILIRFRPTTKPDALFDPSGCKYGAVANDCGDILAVAKDLELNVIGVSFHVGSSCLSETVFENAFEISRSIFEQAENLGFSFSILDIGGGFPGKDSERGLFEKMCHVINRSLDQHFPVSSGVQVIAEPGTYFASSPYTLVTSVIAVKEITKTQIEGVENPPVRFTEGGHGKGYMYYIDDGLFGSFHDVLWYPEILTKPQVLKKPSDVIYPSCIWGDYLDGQDIVERDCQLPKLSVGDWFYFHEFGAYTISVSTGFNGFAAQKHVYYYIALDTWKKMKQRNAEFSTNVVFYNNGKLLEKV